MSEKIRVLIVDDAVVVRKMVSDVLSQDDDIEVAGLAANGKIGLTKISKLKPDVITLDVEMPEMDGLQMLAELQKQGKKIPVIMFSSLTQRGATATLDALSLGASDYVAKPANVGSVSIAMQRVKEVLIPKIKALCSKKMTLSPCIPPVVPPPAKAGFERYAATAEKPDISHLKTTPTIQRRVDILAIGVSTGGPTALADFLPTLPKNLPTPMVVVQHMPPFFTQLLATRLDSKSEISIGEGAPGKILEPGHAWIAPGDFHMVLEKNVEGNIQIKTNKEALENSCRPAVDVLFRSVVEIYGGNTLAVILTGMGQDGLLGCETVKKAGGQVVVQDEETSAVWGMPGFVARAGLAEKVLPLSQIGAEIVDRLKIGRTWIPS